MRSGQRLTLLVAAALGAIGCSRDHYDEQIKYPVRTDLLVRQDESWGDAVPGGFNRPGILPLDALRMPKAEQPPDVQKLEPLIGKKIYDPNTLAAQQRDDYGKHLEEMFGTPAHPRVSGFEPAALKAVDESLTGESIVQTLKLDEATLDEGSRLYRLHCLHCHGLEGNGRGPTGPWLNPPPRDYRQGLFKYTSTNQEQNARKPRRDDILHVLAFGIEGTSMPSFNFLPVEEREAIASYVIHLSIRGEVESRTMTGELRLATESKGAEASDRPKFVMELRDDIEPRLRFLGHDRPRPQHLRRHLPWRPPARGSLQPRPRRYPGRRHGRLQHAEEQPDARGGRHPGQRVRTLRPDLGPGEFPPGRRLPRSAGETARRPVQDQLAAVIAVITDTRSLARCDIFGASCSPSCWRRRSS